MGEGGIVTENSQQQGNQGGEGGDLSSQSGLFWIMLLFLTLYLFMFRVGDGVTSISYTEFHHAVASGQVESVLIRGDELRGRYVGSGKEPPGFDFRTTIPSIEDSGLIVFLQDNSVDIHVRTDQEPVWLQMLGNFLPWLFLLLILVYGMRMYQARMGDRSGGLFGFSRSRARRFDAEKSHIGFDEVAGLENAKQDLMEVVDYLKAPDKFRRLGAKIPRGILMMGPPGTGKTTTGMSLKLSG